MATSNTGFRDFGFDFAFARPRSRRERVARMDALATLLDTAVVLPGTNIRFGLDAVIGLVPGIGDTITTAMSLWIVHEAHQLGAPGHAAGPPPPPGVWWGRGQAPPPRAPPAHEPPRWPGIAPPGGGGGGVPRLGAPSGVVGPPTRRNMRLLQEWLDREDRR